MQEGLGFRGGDLALGALQFRQGRPGLRSLRVGHAQADVVREVAGPSAALQLEEGVGDDLRTACVDDVQDEGTDVRVQTNIPFDPVGQGCSGQRAGAVDGARAHGREAQCGGQPPRSPRGSEVSLGR